MPARHRSFRILRSRDSRRAPPRRSRYAPQRRGGGAPASKPAVVSGTSAQAERGCYIAFDTFGQETWVYPFSPSDRLSDVQRVDLQMALIAEGFLDRLLVSHDVGYKHRLSAYGGCGYAHILSTVVPHHMRRKGMTDEHLHAILVENPARVLQLA